MNESFVSIKYIFVALGMCNPYPDKCIFSILKWFSIRTSPRQTYVKTMLVNEHIDMQHMSSGWIILALDYLKFESNKYFVCTEISTNGP